MTPEAEVLLLIFAANGGEMEPGDARREFERVMSLSPDDRAAWRRRVSPLARANARRALGRDHVPRDTKSSE